MPEFSFSLRERESGRYYVNVNEIGGPFRTNYSLHTTRERIARRRMHKWEDLHMAGEWDPRDGAPGKGDRIPLLQAAKRFQDEYQEHVRESTAGNMKSALRGLMETTGENIPIGHVTPEHVRTHIQQMEGHAGTPGSAAQSTKRKRYGKLKRFFDWAGREGLIDRSPMEEVRRPRGESGDSYHVLSVGDARHLTRTVCREGPRWLLRMIELGLTTGMRRGEMRHLTWADVDTSALETIDPTAPKGSDVVQIKVTEGPNGWKPKQPPSLRTITVYPRGAALLRMLYEGQADGKRVILHGETGRVPGNSIIDKWMMRATKAAGMRPDRDVTLHDLRHTWFTWLLNDLEMAQKVPTVSRMGGHANIERTWSYVRTSDDGGEDLVLKSVGAQSGDGTREAVQRWMCGVPTELEMSAETARSEGQMHS